MYRVLPVKRALTQPTLVQALAPELSLVSPARQQSGRLEPAAAEARAWAVGCRASGAKRTGVTQNTEIWERKLGNRRIPARW